LPEHAAGRTGGTADRDRGGPWREGLGWLENHPRARERGSLKKSTKGPSLLKEGKMIGVGIPLKGTGGRAGHTHGRLKTGA